jgi:hypothetical protein
MRYPLQALLGVQHLFSMVQQGKFPWAMAGRSQSKLEALRDKLAQINPVCKVCIARTPHEGVFGRHKLLMSVGMQGEKTLAGAACSCGFLACAPQFCALHGSFGS